jgi:ribosomal protein S12 methylthiotransferase
MMSIFFFVGFRGKFRSKPWESILEEAKVLVEAGAKEINLIAEDTNQYGMDRSVTPAQAVCALPSGCMACSRRAH